MKGTIINKATGQVLSTVDVDDMSFKRLSFREGTEYIDQIANSMSDYWDGAKFISLVTPPSNHHVFDYDTKTWIDTWDLDVYKCSLIKELKDQSLVNEYEMFTYMGKSIQTDPVSQQRIQSVVVGDHIDWITSDNSVLRLSSDQFNDMKNKLSEHLQSVRAKYTTDKESVLLIKSIDELTAK